MIINPQTFTVNGIQYTIRSAASHDAKVLSELRVRIDGETENLDREPGEAFIDEKGLNSLFKPIQRKIITFF